MGLVSSQISTKKLVPVCRQLATSYNAGIPIIRALDLVADQARDRRIRDVLRAMSGEIQGGSTLTDTARNQADVLPPFFIELLASGEVGGHLDVMLNDLADYYEDRLAMQRTIVGAAIYPAVQLMMAWFLGTFALGLVGNMSFGQKAFSFGDYLNSYFWFQAGALLGFGMVCLVCVVLARLGLFKWIVGWFTTFIWPLAPVTRKFALARFFRSLSLLIASGVPITDCVSRSAAVVGNPYIERDLLGAMPFIREGASLVEAFGGSKYLSRTAREMLLIGEQSGELDKSLRKVSEYHLAEATSAVRAATVIGNVLVGLLVAAIIGYVVITFWTKFYGGMMNELGI